MQFDLMYDGGITEGMVFVIAIRKDELAAQISNLRAALDVDAPLVANPTMPEVKEREGLSVTLRPLPGAEEEARTIASLFPGEQVGLLLAGDATASRVRDNLASHQVIHLATTASSMPATPTLLLSPSRPTRSRMASPMYAVYLRPLSPPTRSC